MYDLRIINTLRLFSTGLKELRALRVGLALREGVYPKPALMQKGCGSIPLRLSLIFRVVVCGHCCDFVPHD